MAIIKFTLDPDNPLRLTVEQRARLDAIADDKIDLREMPEMGDVAWSRPGAFGSPDNKK